MYVLFVWFQANLGKMEKRENVVNVCLANLALVQVGLSDTDCYSLTIIVLFGVIICMIMQA